MPAVIKGKLLLLRDIAKKICKYIALGQNIQWHLQKSIYKLFGSSFQKFCFGFSVKPVILPFKFL